MPKLVCPPRERRKGFSLIKELLLPGGLLFRGPNEQFVLPNERGRDELLPATVFFLLLLLLLAITAVSCRFYHDYSFLSVSHKKVEISKKFLILIFYLITNFKI